MTNRENLRNLSDRALAVKIAKKAGRRCDFCYYTDSKCPNPYSGSCCISGIIKWLNTDTASGGSSHE